MSLVAPRLDIELCNVRSATTESKTRYLKGWPAQGGSRIPNPRARTGRKFFPLQATENELLWSTMAPPKVVNSRIRLSLGSGQLNLPQPTCKPTLLLRLCTANLPIYLIFIPVVDNGNNTPGQWCPDQQWDWLVIFSPYAFDAPSEEFVSISNSRLSANHSVLGCWTTELCLNSVCLVNALRTDCCMY